jgi:O-antigen/teichoic acid export membrane protein
LFQKFRIIKDTVSYTTSALVAQALGLVAGFWVARMLGPSDFGIWNGVSLVLVYGAYMDFGVLSAMGRDLPFFLGQGDSENAASLEGAARWTTIVGATLAACVVIATSFFLRQSMMMLTGLFIMAIVLIVQQVYTYHRTVLRSHNQFGELSRQQFLFSTATAGLAVLCVTVAGLLGRMIAAALAQVAIVLYALNRNPWRPLPRLNLRVTWSLMRVGIPITVSGFILSLVTTVDRPIVIAFLGEKQLGYYGLALLLTSMVSLVPSMASQVLYPRITYRFGQSGRDVAALRSFVLMPPVLLACLLPVAIGPLYFVLPLAITLFLPAYVPSITATRIAVIGIFFYSILGLTDYFLVTIGKLKQYAIFGCIALVLKLAFSYLSLRLGYGIVGVAFSGTLLTYFIYSSVVIGYALSHYTRAGRDWYRYFLRLWLPFAYMLGLLWIVELAVTRLMPASSRVGLILSASAQVVLYLLGTLPLVSAAAHELKLDLSLASLSRAWSGR